MLALWLLKFIDFPTIKRALLCALFFVLVVWSSGYYAIAGSLVVALLVLWQAKRVLTKRCVGYFLIFGWVSIVLVVLLASLHFIESVSGQSFVQMSQLVAGFPPTWWLLYPSPV